MKIITALVGFGLSGKYLQAPFLIQNPAFDLQYIATQSSDPTLSYPTVKKATFEAILANPAIQLVSICSPNPTHYDYAKAVLMANKHVLIEKPICANTRQAQELYDLAQKQQKILYVYQNRRFDSDFLTIKQVIESEKLGKIHTFEAHFDRYKPSLNPKKWKETPHPTSGILYDLGSHLLDQALALFGKPMAFDGQVWTQRQASDIDDAFEIRLNYGHLKVRLKASLLVQKPGPRYVIHGDLGTFEKHGLDPQEDQSKAGLLPNDPAFGQENETQNGTLFTENSSQKIISQKGNWGLLFDNLKEAILDNKPLIIKPEEILEQLLILETIRQ